MKLARQLCLAFVCSIALSGQTTYIDVNGWGKIKWGMTIADASRLYVVERHEDNAFWSQLIAQSVQIGDITMKVSLGAKHGSEQISRVRLWMFFGLGTGRQCRRLRYAQDTVNSEVRIPHRRGNQNRRD